MTETIKRGDHMKMIGEGMDETIITPDTLGETIAVLICETYPVTHVVKRSSVMGLAAISTGTAMDPVEEVLLLRTGTQMGTEPDLAEEGTEPPHAETMGPPLAHKMTCCDALTITDLGENP
jgi:hypothetical protein